MVHEVDHEMKLHLKFCAEFGVAKEDIEAAEENTGTLALRSLFHSSLEADSRSVHCIQQIHPRCRPVGRLVCPAGRTHPLRDRVRRRGSRPPPRACHDQGRRTPVLEVGRELHQRRIRSRGQENNRYVSTPSISKQEAKGNQRRTLTGHETDKIEQHAALQSASRIEELVKIFKHAIKVYHVPWPKTLFVFPANDSEQNRWRLPFGICTAASKAAC